MLYHFSRTRYASYKSDHYFLSQFIVLFGDWLFCTLPSSDIAACCCWAACTVAMSLLPVWADAIALQYLDVTLNISHCIVIK